MWSSIVFLVVWSASGWAPRAASPGRGRPLAALRGGPPPGKKPFTPKRHFTSPKPDRDAPKSDFRAPGKDRAPGKPERAQIARGTLTLEQLEAKLNSKFGKYDSAKDFYDEDDNEEGDEPGGAAVSKPLRKPTKATEELGGWGRDSAFVGGFIVREPTKAPDAAGPAKKTRPSDKGGDALGFREAKLRRSVEKAVEKQEAAEQAAKRKSRVNRNTLAPPEDAADAVPMEDFETLVSADLAAKLREKGLKTATAVQSAALKVLSNEQDALLRAPTGSGKTLAFLLPAIEAIDVGFTAKPQLLVVVPGRELANQIADVFNDIGGGAKCVALCGGANMGRQLEKLKKTKPHAIVGTPGRLAELAFGDGALKLSRLRCCVLDEADALAKAPFANDVESLVKALPNDAQLVLASATIDDLIGGDAAPKDTDSVLVSRAKKAQRVEAGSSPLPTKLAHAKVIVSGRVDLIDSLRRVLRSSEPPVDAAIVFVNDAEAAVRVCEMLATRGTPAIPLAGDSDMQRRAAMDALRRKRNPKKDEPTVVVATELGARGIDAARISHVINYEHLPSSVTHYAHRAGRTGRGPQGTGVVVTITMKQSERILDNIAKTLNVKMHAVEPRDGVLEILS
mmetsp:Transcript_21016/g.72614  ORF Transcript_21016/g.72614 Transcript_21016/m.72614 type:complete len:622 (+) Transcript_21016:3-1868(+)